jgi:hypothetical protein
MRTLVALIVGLCIAGTAVAQDEPARPPAIPSIGSWRHHDPREPIRGREPWSPSDVVSLLERHPEAFLDIGAYDALPAGTRSAHQRGGDVNQAQAIATARGVDVASRMCLPFRFDLHSRPADDVDDCHPQGGGGGCDWEGDMDGSFGEQETVVKLSGVASGGSETRLEDAQASWLPGIWHHRLLVLRPGTAEEERRRVVENGDAFLRVDRSWLRAPAAGDAYQIRGSFDPAWVMQIPRSVHEASVRRFWAEKRNVCPGGACRPPAEPLDPFDPANHRSWQPWRNRKVIESLRTDTSVPAMYGWVFDQGVKDAVWEDPYFGYTSVLTDARNPSYRAWSIRYLMYKLQDHGIDPGEPACLMLAYKPGFHTWYDEPSYGPSSHSCSLPGTHVWVGPAFVCDTPDALGGPFDPTPYGRGEYEKAVNDYIREMIATLGSRGYGDLRIVTVERPAFRHEFWSILAGDVRTDREIWGEWGASLEPKLAEIAPPPGGGPAPAAAPTAGAPVAPRPAEPEPQAPGAPVADDAVPPPATPIERAPDTPAPNPSVAGQIVTRAAPAPAPRAPVAPVARDTVPTGAPSEPTPTASLPGITDGGTTPSDMSPADIPETEVPSSPAPPAPDDVPAALGSPSPPPPSSTPRSFTIGTPSSGHIEKGSQGGGGGGVVEPPSR